MHKKSNLVVVGGLASVTVVTGALLASPMAGALDEHIDTTSITIGTSCSMAASVDTEHTATLMGGTYSATNYPNGIGKTTLTTSCNDLHGYAIYAVGYTNDEIGNTVLEGTDLGSTYDIVTGTATSGTVGNDVSNWAMRVSAVDNGHAPTILNGFGSFSAVPSTYTKVAESEVATGNSKVETTYAAYISHTQPAGTYAGQVKYVMVHPGTQTESYVMQNVADWAGDLLPGVQYNVTDSRDGNDYTVALLADGNIWMTKNLDLAGGTTLTPANSNVATNYTLPASRTSANGGVTLDGGFDNDTVADIYNSNSTTCGNNQPCYSYYSYMAATAGTNPSSGDAQYDICPKGWRLPGYTEYNTLIRTYTTGTALTASPFYGVYAGSYLGSSFRDGGSLGFYWSSTADSASGAYLLYFDSSNAGGPGRSYVKWLGYPIRCIKDNRQAVTLTTGSGATSVSINGTNYTGSVRLMPGTYNISGNYSSGYEFNSWSTSGSISVASTSSASTTLTVTGTGTLTLGTRSCATTIRGAMQAFDSSALCSNATSGTLTDSRDNQTYAVGKLADGRWWLLDNLALDLTNSTVKANLSAANTNASNETLAYLKNGGGTASDKYAMVGVTTWDISQYQYWYSGPKIIVSGTGNNGDWTKDTEVALAMQQSGTGKIGVYYNYCAASAGSYCYGNAATGYSTSSGNATEDICPAGWRMPTGGSRGEYQALLTALSNNKAAFANALLTPLSGMISSSVGDEQGAYGNFWSSTRYNDGSMYDLRVGVPNVRPQEWDSRSYGLSVRCILDS